MKRYLLATLGALIAGIALSLAPRPRPLLAQEIFNPPPIFDGGTITQGLTIAPTTAPAHLLELDGLAGDHGGINMTQGGTPYFTVDTSGYITNGTWQAGVIGTGYGGTGDAGGALSVWSCVVPTTTGTGVNYCPFQAQNSATTKPYFDAVAYSLVSGTCSTGPSFEIYEISSASACSNTFQVGSSGTASVGGNSCTPATNKGATYVIRSTTAGSSCTTGNWDLGVTLRQ